MAETEADMTNPGISGRSNTPSETGHAGGSGAGTGAGVGNRPSSDNRSGGRRGMTRGRMLGIGTGVLLVVAFVMVNVWAGNRAADVPPLKEALVASLGLVDQNSSEAQTHLVEARGGFFFMRAWHWMRYSQLTG
jgi:hypothetical protein